MALYVMRPPDPPPGVDWLTAVPGEYLYNVTGITATLAALGGDPNVAVDSSGFGNDGIYVNDWTHHVAGLVAGNDAAHSINDQGFIESFYIPDPTAAITFVGWHTRTLPGPRLLPFSVPAAGGHNMILVQVVGTDSNSFGDPAGAIRVELDALGATAVSAGGVWVDPGPHMLVVSVTPSFGVINAYVDGVNVLNVALGPVVYADAPEGVNFLPGAAGANPIMDELAVFDYAFQATQPNDLYVASFAGFAAYNAAVMNRSPVIYYHLDDPVAGAGRQALLNITDATHRVLLVPTGFAAGPNPGTYAYSWQPRLAASSQTPDQLFTTVATPALVLPAGYSIGTNTPDLAPSDQWSNVAVWWDSNIMDAQAGLGAYLFPPPVHLVYHQEQPS